MHNRIPRKRSVVCIEFDGVLRDPTNGKPIEHAIQWLAHANLRVTIAIFSTRSRNLSERRVMQEWLRRQLRETYGESGLVIFKQVKWPWFKPAAIVSIDAKAVCFGGDWLSPHLGISNLLRFRPWYLQLPHLGLWPRALTDREIEKVYAGQSIDHDPTRDPANQPENIR